jgi:cardiolipin synthase
MTDRRFRARPLLAFGLLAAVVGCNAPAAHFACYAPDEGGPARPALLARQVAADSAVEMTCHPLWSSWSLLCEGFDCLRAAVRDVAGTRLALCLAGKPPPVADCRPTLDPAALEEGMAGLIGKPLQPAHVQLFLSGGEALTALEQVIDQATCRLDVLMFMWDSDPLGETVAKRLAAKAGPEFRVRVLVDGGGNLIFGEPGGASVAEVNRVVSWLAQQPYVEVLRTRNPFFRFDHRKLVLADGRVAWTGGRNFTYPAFFKQHDLSFTLQGPLVDELQACYEQFWSEQGGEPVGREQKAESSPEPEGRRQKAEGSRGPWLPSAFCLLPSAANAYARLVGTEPRRPHLARALYHVIDEARHHVYLENPYPNDGRLMCKLAQARRRGADVRVVMTITGDVAVVNRANRVVANRLLNEGIRVYLFPGMTHVKAAAVDGCWAYVGTGNFDPVSLRYTRELGMAVSAGPLIAELEERLFAQDFCPDWELKEPLPVSGGDHACELLTSLCL